MQVHSRKLNFNSGMVKLIIQTVVNPGINKMDFRNYLDPGFIPDANGNKAWMPIPTIADGRLSALISLGFIGCLILPIVTGLDTYLLRPPTFLARPKLWLEELGKRGKKVPSKDVLLEEPLKALTEEPMDVTLRFPHEVTAVIKVSVVPE